MTIRSRGGIFGRILSGATEGLLGAGMLNAAVSRIAREVEALHAASARRLIAPRAEQPDLSQ